MRVLSVYRCAAEERVNRPKTRPVYCFPSLPGTRSGWVGSFGSLKRKIHYIRQRKALPNCLVCFFVSRRRLEKADFNGMGKRGVVHGTFWPVSRGRTWLSFFLAVISVEKESHARDRADKPSFFPSGSAPEIQLYILNLTCF